jgi:hypothetical protein
VVGRPEWVSRPAREKMRRRRRLGSQRRAGCACRASSCAQAVSSRRDAARRPRPAWTGGRAGRAGRPYGPLAANPSERESRRHASRPRLHLHTVGGPLPPSRDLDSQVEVALRLHHAARGGRRRARRPPPYTATVRPLRRDRVGGLVHEYLQSHDVTEFSAPTGALRACGGASPDGRTRRSPGCEASGRKRPRQH